MKSIVFERQLESVEQDAREGMCVNALQRIAQLLDAKADEMRLYELAFKVMCMGATDGFRRWNSDEKSSLYRKLIIQENCDARPYLFHHGLASLLTSRNTDTANALLVELTPTLLVLLDEDCDNVLIQKPLTLFLTVARSVVPKSISQKRISKLHVHYFRNFTIEDLALPYSIAFNAEAFGKNCIDLIKRYPGNTALLLEEELDLEHLLHLSWLGVGNLFDRSDNRDLFEALRYRLRPDSRESSFSAARSLILRFWRPGSVLTGQVLGELGLESNLPKIAQRIDLKSNDLATSPAVRRNEALPWQAIRALRNISRLVMPTPSLSKRNVRVAVCVSGQLRGYREAFPSWLRFFLRSADFDIFVHSWERVGRAGAQPWRVTLPFSGPEFCKAWRRIGLIEGYDAMQARYPSLCRDLDDGGRVTESKLQEFYNAKSVILEDETDERFASFSNQDKMHYKIHAAHQMATESGLEYDLFVRLRPDLSLGISALDWNDMAQACGANSVLYCESPFGLHYGQPAIGDQIAVASSRTLRAYAKTWKIHGELAAMRLFAYPQKLTGHISLAQVCWLSGIRAARLPVKLGQLKDPEKMSSAAIFAAISKDSSGRWDSTDRAFLDALMMDRRERRPDSSLSP